MELCSKDRWQLLKKQLPMSRRRDYFLTGLGWRHHWLRVIKLRRGRCLDSRGSFYGTFKMDFKVEQKEESALAMGAVRKGFAKLVLKQWLSKDTLPKNSGAMMCGVPSNPTKDTLIIGNTRVSLKRCFSDDFYGDSMGEHRGGLLLGALMLIMTMELCLCCSWGGVFYQQALGSLIIDCRCGRQEVFCCS